MVKNEWKKLLTNPLLIVVIAAIILIPSIYAGLFLASMWDPYGELDKLPVAIVNLDQGAVYEGKELKIGDELVENLREDGSLNFSVTDRNEALTGLKEGRYYMVVTIPEDFSSDAVTVTSEDPVRMELQYETNPATNYVAMKLSESAMTKIEMSLQQKISDEYAKVIFEKFGDISTGMHDAAEGADLLLDGEAQLSDGAAALNDGASALNTGAGELRSGTTTLYNGAIEFNNGLHAYLDGAGTINGGLRTLDNSLLLLSSGASDLHSGANSLAGGTAALRTGADSLVSGTSSLSTGASSLASGTSELATGADSLASGLNDLSTGLDTLNSSAPALTSGIASLNSGAGDLASGIGTYTAGVSSAYQGASSLNTGINTLSDSTSALAAGSADFNSSLIAIDQYAQTMAATGDPYWVQMAAYTSGLVSGYAQIDGGISALNGNMPALCNGSGQLVTGLQALDTAGADLNSGAQALSSGAATLNAAAPQLENGIAAASQGAHTLRDGADALSSGADTVAAGAAQLAGGASSLSTGATTLYNGITTVDQGAAALADGAGRLDSGLAQASTGADTLYNGSNTLVGNNDTLLGGSSSIVDGAQALDDGAAELLNGTGELADGTSELVSSLPELSSGTMELRDGLADGASRIDSNSLEDINAEMVANPVDTSETRLTEVKDNGHAMAAYMMSVGLWVASLAFCLMYPLTKHDKLTSGFSWWLSKASVLYPMAILQAVILVAILHAKLGFTPVRFAGTVLIACLASMTFMSLMYFFNVLLGKVGSFLMLIFMVLQLAGSAGTYPLEISGPLAQALNRFMPFTYTVTAFRSTIGGGEECSHCIAVLIAILAVSSLLTVLLFMVRAGEEQAGRKNLYNIMEEKGFA